MKKNISFAISFVFAFLFLISLSLAGEMTPEEYALWKEEQMSTLDIAGYVTDPYNNYIGIAVDSYGRFTMAKANGLKLIYGYPNPGTSFSTIRIDGSDYTNKGRNFGTIIAPPPRYIC